MVSWLLGALLGLTVVAQTADAQGSQTFVPRTQGFSLGLPVPRPLHESPSVPTTGVVGFTVEGQQRTLPQDPELAWADLRLFTRHLESLFPVSASYYPADSIQRVITLRAGEWLIQLDGLGTSHRNARQLVALARVAMAAEQDSLAISLFRTRLTEVHRDGKSGTVLTTAVAVSAVLADAIVTLTDVDQSHDRLIRNVDVAEEYVTQLLALPVQGHPTHSDSTNILYRQYGALLALLTASDVLQRSERVLQYANQMLTLISNFNHQERVQAVSMVFPYRQVAMAAMTQAGGRARLDALDRTLLQLVVPRADEWSVYPREIPQDQLRSQWQWGVRNQITSFALLGTHASPIDAHAWLNTEDSMYTATPRIQRLDDGKIRVVTFGRSSTEILPALDRLQRHFADTVEVIFVTSTNGNIGPDLVTPAEETAWLQRYYGGRRSFTFTVAVWAGEKVPGAYGSLRPQPSPVPERYHAGAFSNTCIVIDRGGIIRAYLPLNTRTQEAQAIRRIETLVSPE